MRTTAIVLLVTVMLARAAEAQEISAGISAYTPFGIDDLDGRLPVSAEVRVTIPLSANFAVEPFLTAGTDQARRDGLEGFYGLQIRQVIARFAGADAFATYGVAAYYSKSGYDGPAIGHFGLGIKQRLLRHVAFRPEVQLVTYHVVPIGARFVAGFSLVRER